MAYKHSEIIFSAEVLEVLSEQVRVINKLKSFILFRFVQKLVSGLNSAQYLKACAV